MVWRDILLAWCSTCHPSPSLFISMAIFPGDPGKGGFIAAKGDGGDGDNWS